MSRRNNERINALMGIILIVLAFVGSAKLLGVELNVPAFVMSIKPILP